VLGSGDSLFQKSGFILTSGDPGSGKMAAELFQACNAVFCCCWALFAILVVAGIMSLAWMLVLTLVVFAEKVFPHGQRVSATIGVALIVLGVVVLGSIF
jgi:predicted metal-binding membrane protein